MSCLIFKLRDYFLLFVEYLSISIKISCCRGVMSIRKNYAQNEHAVLVEKNKNEKESEGRERSYIRELAPSHAVEEKTAAFHLVDTLVGAGVDVFFGVPGGPIISVFDAILQIPQASLIESRHEAWGTFAAAGYWRATGRVPAVVVTAGPGGTNAITGIVSAHLEGIPLLLICGDVASSATGGRHVQDMGGDGIDIESMVRHVTRAAIRVPAARCAASYALTALQAATNSRRPGPALLVLPVQHGFAKVSAVQPIYSTQLPPRQPVLPSAVETTADLLMKATCPLLVLGGALRSHKKQVRRLVDLLHVPFLTTPRAKGIVSELHPCSLRNGGLAASSWARDYTAGGVDVALAMGTDLDDCSVGPLKLIAAGGKLIHVDNDPTVFQRNEQTCVPIVADVANFIEALIEIVAKKKEFSQKKNGFLREVKQRSPVEVIADTADKKSSFPPHHAIADLQRAAKDDAIFVTDIGEHMLFALHYLTITELSDFHIFLNLGSMGSGICGAIGLAIGAPSRQVICVCGDGSMQMVGMEILVAIRLRLPIVFAVFNDSRYNMVYHGYRVICGREAPWSNPPIDFVGWAKSLGIPAIRINEKGEINEKILSDLTREGLPVVLDMRIDANVRLRGAGRLEAIQHMSTPVEISA